MSLFIGTDANETITPDLVSASVTVLGEPKKPSAAADLISAGGGDDVVAGGGGNDIAFLGAGDDTFIWQPGDGSDTVDGGTGNDRLVFQGSSADESLAVSAGRFGLASLTRDVGDVRMTLNDIERVELATLDGKDHITVNDLSNTAVKEVAIDLAGALNAATGDGAADIVTVNGSAAADQINIGSNGTTVVVSGLAATTTIDHADPGLDQLVIRSRGGDDVVNASSVQGANVELTLDGGAGDDTLTGSGNADVLLGGAGDDSVTGGRGNDLALLGSGDDGFIWNPGDGSDVVEGQAGFDTLDFNGANIGEHIDISANGERARFFRDVGSVTMDLNSVERIHFSALGGADDITVNDLSGTHVREVAIDLAAIPGTTQGDGQIDQVHALGDDAANTIEVHASATSVSLTGLSTALTIDHAEGQDRLIVDGLGGNDTISATAVPAGAISITLQGGAGNDRLTGSAGDDQLLGGADDDVLIGGAGSDRLFGDDGNDRLIWNAGDGSDLAEGGDGSDTLEVNDGNDAQTLTITANGTRVRIDGIDSAPFNIDAGTIENIVINANGGDDHITAGNGLSTLVQLTLDGGAGNDVIVGGDGADILLGGDGNDSITGGRGNDLALLGAGDDAFIWNPGEGSDVVEGGSGTDTMQFFGANVSENIDISANGERVRFFRDVGNVTMDLKDVEHIDFAARGGADVITVGDLSATDVTQVNIDLAAIPGTPGGDGQADSVTINGSNAGESIEVLASGSSLSVTGLSASIQVNDAESADRLIIKGLGGNDTISAATLTADAIGLTIDGGAGNDTIIGGAGNDTLIGGDGNDFVRGGRGNDFALLGTGNDQFIWTPGEGSDIVEGQSGFDTLEFDGANIAENIDISANGERVRLFRDVGSVTMDLNDVERIALSALGGADSIVVHDLSGTDATQIAIDLAGVDPSSGDGQSDHVTVEGTVGNDTIQVGQSGHVVTVHGLAADVSIVHAEAQNDVLVVSAGAGDDVIDASHLHAGVIGTQLLGGDGADTIIGSAGDDFVNGGRGNDVARLGGGDDVFVWNPGEGSDTVEGQGGFDTLVFQGANVSEKIDILANGDRAQLSRDIGTVKMDLDGVERINLATLGGTDNVTVHDLSGTDVKQVAIDLGATGGVPDGQADQVTVQATARPDAITVAQSGSVTSVTGLPAQVTLDHTDAGLDSLTIEGGAGNDVIDASSMPAAAPALTLDGGDGDDVLRGGAGNEHLLGGAGDDVLVGGAGDDILDGGAGDDVLIGGAGNDIFLNGEINIQDFQAGAGGEQDKIDLKGVAGVTDFASVMAHAHDVGANTQLDFGAGEHITLQNVHAADLHAGNFLL
jgi:Ca2+-binding RTX toxin-like protein